MKTQKATKPLLVPILLSIGAECEKGYRWHFICPCCKKELAKGAFIFIVLQEEKPLKIIVDEETGPHYCPERNGEMFEFPYLVKRIDQRKVFMEEMRSGLIKESDWARLKTMNFDDLPKITQTEINECIGNWLKNQPTSKPA